MGERWKCLAILLLLVVVVGCGGGEDPTTANEERLYPWIKGPTREFLVPGGDNAIATFGREATKAEREQASRVIEGWMRARAARNWAEDCGYFSKAYIQTLVVEDARVVSKGKAKTCPQALAYFGPQASGDYKNTLSGPIDSLRVRRDQGFAQYHGRDGRDWVVPMNREEGRWWVSIAAPIERNQ